jgi:hypothetical protein
MRLQQSPVLLINCVQTFTFLELDSHYVLTAGEADDKWKDKAYREKQNTPKDEPDPVWEVILLLQKMNLSHIV